jgi:multiple sugar transport system ATP-binding protein
MPPMNFFDGVLKRVDGRLRFDEAAENGLRMPVPPQLVDPFASQVGRPIVVGIRPEHLHLTATGRPDGCSLTGTLSVIEPLGKDMDAYVRTAGNASVIARLEATTGLQPGSPITLYVDPQKAHFFEPGETGANLAPAGPAAPAFLSAPPL